MEPNDLVQRESGLYMIAGNDSIAQIYVPPGRREALIRVHHEGIKHLAADKTYQSLRRNYYWPTMRKDVRDQYNQYTFCELSKARWNQAHGKIRAVKSCPPRTRWAMDWYGVGDGHVLGIIDLDSLHLEAGYSTDTTAVSTRQLVNDHILYRHGPMDSLRSDHAREFMGKLMQSLKARHGYVHTSTDGCNATGNATIERVWGYLKVCLQRLTDDEYKTFRTIYKKWYGHGTLLTLKACP